MRTKLLIVISFTPIMLMALAGCAADLHLRSGGQELRVELKSDQLRVDYNDDNNVIVGTTAHDDAH